MKTQKTLLSIAQVARTKCVSYHAVKAKLKSLREKGIDIEEFDKSRIGGTLIKIDKANLHLLKFREKNKKEYVRKCVGKSLKYCR